MDVGEDLLSIRSRLEQGASLEEIKRVYPAVTEEQRMVRQQFWVPMHVAEFACMYMVNPHPTDEVALYLALEYIREGCKIPAGRYSGPAQFIHKLLETTMRYPDNMPSLLGLVPIGLFDPEEEVNGQTLTEHAYRIGGAALRDKIMAATTKRRRIHGPLQVFPDMTTRLEDEDDPYNFSVVASNGARIGFHRNVIKRSEFFAGLLRSGMQEAATHELVVDDLDEPTLQWFRAALYKGSTTLDFASLEGETDVLSLLGLANRFQVSFIAQGLEHLIIEQGLISASTILTIFDTAFTLRCTQLQQMCLNYVKSKDLLTVLGEIVNADENAGRERELGQLVKALAASQNPSGLM